MHLTRRNLNALIGGLAAGGLGCPADRARAQAGSDAGGGAPTPEEARRIARDAYVYTYPMVENYNSIYQFALDPAGGQYKGPPNQIHNVARVFGPNDTGVVTPNSDTPYSFLIMDLRAEPLVVTMPPVEKERYYSLQLVDLYTHNFDYLGTRIDGNGGGDFLVAGPDWQGDLPPAVKRVVRAETRLVFSQFRTQLRDPPDLPNVERVQAGYRARPLSAYLRHPASATPPAIAFPRIGRETIEAGLWGYANFLLQFCPVHPSERTMRDRFARIGVAPGTPWPPAGLPAETRAAIEQGHQDGRREVEQAAAKATTSIGLFGTRGEMAGKELERAVGAKVGLYGNSAEEAVYPAYQLDEAGAPLDAGRFDYELTFASGKLPPVNAFWSVTMYDGQTRYLVDNPLGRYVVNSPMLPDLDRDADGGITLQLRHRSPGPGKERNWLPAPNGPMSVVMRLYLPQPEVLSGAWSAPPIRRVGEAAR